MGYGSKQVWATTLTANDSSQKEELGLLRFSTDGKIYRYGRTVATLAKGDVVRFYTSNRYSVTPSASTAGLRRPAGVALGALTVSYYGWLQCGGFCDYVRTTSAVAAADTLVLGHATDSAVVTATSATAAYNIGQAIKADAGHICSAAVLRNMI